LRQRASRDVVRQQVGEGDDRAMTLIERARAALDFAEARDVRVVRPDAVAVGSAVFVAFDSV
jgi:hypothetical protein